MQKYKYFKVKNANLELWVTDLGGIITHLFAPDSKGKVADIVLGHEKAEAYLKSNCYLGAIAGRVANRIGSASFILDDKKFLLAKNDNAKNSLHGGIKGFDKVVWDVCECSGDGWKGLCLHYLSKDGEEGFPGNLDITVYYKLTNDDELVVEYMAYTDKATPCAPTQHTYFNLSGAKSDNIYGHSLQVNAAFFTPVDANLIPTGEILTVRNTPLDLIRQKKLGDVITKSHPLLDLANGGIDHNFVLPNSANQLTWAATLSDSASGRNMDVFTTCPGIQVYTGNFLNKIKGKGGKIYNKHAGICLETQFMPDSVNKEHFPNMILRPSEQFYSATVYKFR